MKSIFAAFARLCLFGGLMALSALPAHATHFRYGSLTWKPTDLAPRKVSLSLVMGFRRDFPFLFPSTPPNLGDLLEEGGTYLRFGDGAQTGEIWFRVTAVNLAEDW